MIDNAPFQKPINGILTPDWVQWLTKIAVLVGCLNDSGTTAQRPTKMLFVGRRYIDLTLGKPIWLKTVSPVVWIDATGASV